jgi:hypothetical protein
MAELNRYRRHYGLAALPYGGETTPLLLLIGRIHRTLTRGGVHLIKKQVFDNAIDHLQSTGEAHERATERLRQASVHWLRHTAGSQMMDGQVDRRYVRDNLGHESISTLVPLRDTLQALQWLAALFGSHVVWRGARAPMAESPSAKQSTALAALDGVDFGWSIEGRA